MRHLPAFLSALLLASTLFVSGCPKDAMVTETMDEVGKLTDEVISKVQGAEDKKAALAEAKAMIEARQDELGPKMAEISELRGFQVSEETVGKFTESLLDTSMKMTSLQVELMLETAQDPELDAALTELIDAHEKLLDL